MIDPTITAASCAALENAINASLSLDKTTRAKLADYGGRIIHVVCSKPQIDFYIRIDEKIEILQHCEQTVDAGINGPAKEWLALLTADDMASALINGKLSIQGDSNLFMELRTIAEDIQLDWQGYIARFIGDVPAHFAGKAANSAVNFGKQARKTLHRTVDDFLHEEARLLPKRIECENFYSQLRTLEMQLDRIDAQVKRVAANRQAHSTQSNSTAKPQDN